MSLFRPTYTDKATGERKESAIWWYEFVYAGQRIRQSAKTTRKTLAEAAEKDHRRRLEHAYAGKPVEQPQQRVRTVTDALKTYKTAYATGHREKSVAWVKERAVHVERLLGSTILADLSEARIREYMNARLEEEVGNRTINMELLCLSRAVGKPGGNSGQMSRNSKGARTSAEPYRRTRNERCSRQRRSTVPHSSTR